MSRNSQLRSEATCATICDLPTPQAPQMWRGTRSVMSAWSASKSSEGFIGFPLEGLLGLCELTRRKRALWPASGRIKQTTSGELLSYEDREQLCEGVEMVSS